jgi:hypothetical protein
MLLIGAMGGGAGLAILSAGTAGAGSPAKLAIVAPSTVNAVVRGRPGHRTAAINVIVENTGDTTTSLTGDVLIDDSVNPGCHTTHLTPALTPASIDAHSAIPMRVVVPVAQDCAGRSGTLLIKGVAGVDAAAARFALIRKLGATKTSLPAFVALAMTLISLLVLCRMVGGVWFVTSRDVAIGPGWTLSSSWLTNVGAVGALLGGVLAATSFLSDLVPGLSTAPFIGLSLAYGGTVIGAPIVYYAFSKQQPDPSKPDTNAAVTIGTYATHRRDQQSTTPRKTINPRNSPVPRYKQPLWRTQPPVLRPSHDGRTRPAAGGSLFNRRQRVNIRTSLTASTSRILS